MKPKISELSLPFLFATQPCLSFLILSCNTLLKTALAQHFRSNQPLPLGLRQHKQDLPKRFLYVAFLEDFATAHGTLHVSSLQNLYLHDPNAFKPAHIVSQVGSQTK